MAKPTYVGGVTGSYIGTNTSFSVSLTALTGGSNSSPSEGDLVIISYGRCNTSDIDLSISGYAEHSDLYANGANADANQAVAQKFMGATPDTSITVPSSGTSGQAHFAVVQVWRGVHSVTPFDVSEIATATNTSGSLPDPASVTPTVADSIVIIAGLGAIRGSQSTGANFNTPSGITNFIQINTNQTTGSYDIQAAMGSYESWTSGAYDPAAWTGGANDTSGSWTAWTGVLRPASATQNVTKDSTGSIAFSGTETHHRSVAKSPSGSIAFSGAATAAFGSLRNSTGSIDFSGASSQVRVVKKTPSGALAFSGAATAEFVGVNVFNFSSTGSLNFSGAITKWIERNKTSVGSIAFNNAALKATERVKSSSGSLTFNGAATHVEIRPFNSNGSIDFSGTAGFIRKPRFTASGSLVLGGTAGNRGTRAGSSVWNYEINAAVGSEQDAASVWTPTDPTGVGSVSADPSNVWK